MKGSSTNNADLVEAASHLIKSAKYCVAVTGAGISTSSGIPDFRSARSGLWTRYSPMEVASLSSFRSHPERFYRWLRPLVRNLLDAKPNPAHHSLASLEIHHYVKHIITQNFDALHQRAGSMSVVEIHGTYQTLTCLDCQHQVNAAEDLLSSFLKDGSLPSCPRCGKLLKPDVVLFEEQLPRQQWKMAQQAAQDCDLMLVLGSSLTVAPVSNLPLHASRAGARLILINKTPTPLDRQADIVIHDDVAVILPIIEKKVLRND